MHHHCKEMLLWPPFPLVLQFSQVALKQSISYLSPPPHATKQKERKNKAFPIHLPFVSKYCCGTKSFGCCKPDCLWTYTPITSLLNLVRMMPGARAFTLTLCSPSSIARAFTSPNRAVFEIEYTPRFSSGENPAMEETNNMFLQKNGNTSATKMEKKI
eukprot:m.38372 g.38372  ORF g.38372 m.38372 type:complete len:158 (+) comp10213_c0_seq2:161-634(+)